MRAFLALALLAPTLLAQRWAVQYFYDEDRSQLQIVDLVFPSAERGFAAGILTEYSGKQKFTAMWTSDGGAHWTLDPFKEEPRSLFFLNDSLGWMVTDKGIWKTEESGRTWRKISDQKKSDKTIIRGPSRGLILRVAFFDSEHGFAVGDQKSLFETHDGGRTWMPVAEAAKPESRPEYSSYSRIVLQGQTGFVVGSSNPPRPGSRNALPVWVAPEQAAKRRQVPQLTLLLETQDKGATWRSTTAPLFGYLNSMAISGTRGLSVFAFDENFEVPSEVYNVDFAKGTSVSTFRQKDRRVSSAALFGSQGFIAAVEPTGRLNSPLVPGKVKILRSTDLKNWEEMPVDYKAVAGAVLLAGPDSDHLWAATDTGMILHLAK